MKLRHHCVFSIVENNLPVDKDSFMIQTMVKEFDEIINNLLTDIEETQELLRKIKKSRRKCMMKNAEFEELDKKIKNFATFLFDDFIPITKEEELWCEYLHTVYELVIPDYINLNDFSTIIGMSKTFDIIKDIPTPSCEKTSNVIEICDTLDKIKDEIEKLSKKFTIEHICTKVNKRYNCISAEESLAMKCFKLHADFTRYNSALVYIDSL